MAEVFKTIFEMDSEGDKVLKELDTIKEKYTGINTSMRDQEKELERLVVVTNRLKDAARNALNPTQAVFYRNEIKKNETQIDTLRKSLEAVAVTERKVGNEAKTMQDQIGSALNTTKVNALNTSLTNVENTIKTSLKGQLRGLKEELANATDDEEITRLAIETGKLKDKIDDASDAARVFATDSPFEAVGNGIGSVAQKLLSLDFAGAAAQSKLLLKASQQITFKESLVGIKQLGTTLFNVGRALLTNPVFLIGAAIVGIISNFDKLKNAGGLVGTVFKELGNIITGLENSFFALTDAIGLTNIALQKLNEAKINKLAENLDDDIKTLDRYVKAIKATGKETEEAELAKQKAIVSSSRKQLELLDEITGRGKNASDEQKKQRKDLVNAILDAENETYVIEQTSLGKRRDAAKKYGDDVSKIFDDLNKRLRDAQTKGEEFNIKFRVDNNSEEQVKRSFELRKSLEEQEIKDLTTRTLKEVKSKQDKEKALAKIDQIAKQQTLNRENELNKEILDIRFKNGQDSANISKDNANKLIDQYKADTLATEFVVANERLEIQKKYYEEVIALAEKDIKARKALGLNVLDAEKALNQLRLEAATENAKAQDDLNHIELNERIKSIDAEQSHVESVLKRRNALQSSQTVIELKAEKSRLAAIIASNEATEDEIRASHDRIAELDKKAKQQRIEEIVDMTNQIVQQAFRAANEIISAKIKEVDSVINLQQKRVDELNGIADKGNAEVLEAEKKRLDDLNKEREKYVRAQQALAVVELIANTAVTVSKAAAQGGVAAGVTIAAALLALVGGLISARSIASQAAFYEGGYTGDGNPREESNQMGGRKTSRPYVWHKKEFVFDHMTTHQDDNLNIFKDIHAGRINLTELRDKSEMFDSMRMIDFNKKAELIFNPNFNNSSDFGKIESKLDDLTRAVSNQERALIEINEKGFVLRLSNIERRGSLISDLSK